MIATSVLLSLVACEVLVRALVRRDADGQDWILGKRLRPDRLALARIADKLAALEGGQAFLTWDADLGWAPRPHARSPDGTARSDGAGIRGDREVSVARSPGVLRVAVFGDSFTFGDEVADDETWAAFLERGLAARDVAAEVLNFGVSAYGQDQAYLRWRRDGRRYRPDVVVFGFQPENALRNLNVFRPLYFADTGTPMQKPRFVASGDALVVVGQPTLAPRELLRVLQDLEHLPFVAHDRFAAPYANRWWLRSKLLALLTTVVAGDTGDPFVLTDEGHQVARRLIAAFAQDVAASGSAFVVVHLPRAADLDRIGAGGDTWYGELLRELDAGYRVVHPENAMQRVDGRRFAEAGHYAPTLNRVVGEALVPAVLEAARSR